MEKKDYLVEELSKEEKLYLKRIVMTAKNKYVEKNYQYINNADLSLNEEIIEIENGESFLESVFEKCLKEVKSAEKFDKTLSNPKLRKYIGALSLKEKEVLFYLYWEEKEINEVAKIMNMYRGTIRKIRDNTLSKIAKKIINGGD